MSCHVPKMRPLVICRKCKCAIYVDTPAKTAQVNFDMHAKRCGLKKKRVEKPQLGFIGAYEA